MFRSPGGHHWFVIGGNGCCFCSLGGDGKLWRARGPLGPFEQVGQINPPLPDPPNATYTPYTVPSQQFGVYPIRVTVPNAVGHHMYCSTSVFLVGVPTPLIIVCMWPFDAMLIRGPLKLVTRLRCVVRMAGHAFSHCTLACAGAARLMA